MSYEICKSIVLTKDKKVFLTTRSNNVSPSIYSRWECKSLSKIFESEGKEKVLIELGIMIWEGNLQLRNGSKLVNLFDKAMRQIRSNGFYWSVISSNTIGEFLAKAILKYQEDPNASLDTEIEELKTLQNNREYILKVAKEDQMSILNYIDDESIKTDKEFVMEVIRLCGRNVMFQVPAHFKDDEEVALAIVLENGNHYSQLGIVPKLNREIILEAYRERENGYHAFRITDIPEAALMIPGTNEIDTNFVYQLLDVCPSLQMQFSKLLHIREIAVKWCEQCSYFPFDICLHLPRKFAEEEEFQEILRKRCRIISGEDEEKANELNDMLCKLFKKRDIVFR